MSWAISSVLLFVLIPVFSRLAERNRFAVYLVSAAIAVAIQLLWVSIGGSAEFGAVIGSIVSIVRASIDDSEFMFVVPIVATTVVVILFRVLP